MPLHKRRSAWVSGELYFQWGVMIIVFIVHSLAGSLMNFPSHFFRGTAPKHWLKQKTAELFKQVAFFISFSKLGLWLFGSHLLVLMLLTHEHNLATGNWGWQTSGFRFDRLNHLVFWSNSSETGEQELQSKMVNKLLSAPTLIGWCVFLPHPAIQLSVALLQPHIPSHTWLAGVAESVYFKYLNFRATD